MHVFHIQLHLKPLTTVVTKPLLRILTFLVFSFSIGASYASQKLNGVAIHSELNSEKFIGGVYTEKPTSSAKDLVLGNGHKRIEIRVLAERLWTRRFKRMWIEGIAINAAPKDLKKHAHNLAQFSNMLKFPLQKNDILKIERNPKKGVVIELNGVAIGSIKDPYFFDVLLKTWIGPVPLSSNFKAGILKGGDIQDKDLVRFLSVFPSKERIADIETSMSPNRKIAALKKAPTKSKKATTKPKKATAKPEKITTKLKKVAPAVKVASVNKKSNTKTIAEIERPTAKKNVNFEKPKEFSEQNLAQKQIDTPMEEEFESNAGATLTAEGLLKQQLYILKLKRWIYKYIQYPAEAIENNQEGSVSLSITISRVGHLQRVEQIARSEYSILNNAANSAAKSADPYPPIPEEISAKTFVFTIPIVYKIK